ncbi:hypothetical protein ACFLR6_02570 [Campylobacterota bacterium]
MNKLLKIIGSTLLFLLLIIVGLYFLTFSPIGSSILKPYIKKELEEKIGMPVDINTFDLEYGTSILEFSINKQAQVSIELSEYDLLNDSYEGMYHIKTDKFTYNNKKLNKVDIKGKFKYMPEDVYVEGKGTALHAKVDYRLNIIDNLPQQILLNIKDAQLSEVLQLTGHPDIAEGKIDVKVNIPDMGGDRENIYGYIELKKSYFKPARVEELYDYTLPEKSYLYGRIDGNLEGEHVKLVGDVQSNLFVLQIKNALVNIFSEGWSTEYDLDVKDMRILTKNKLAGALDLRGKIETEGKWIHITSNQNSLGEELRFSTWTGGKNLKIIFKKVVLERFLTLLKQPDYAKGELSGTVGLDWNKDMDIRYDIRIVNGILTSKAIKKMSRYKIPEENAFSLESKGKVYHKKLTGNATIKSTLADAGFTSLQYDLKQKLLISNYDLLIHDVNALIANENLSKGAPVRAEGKLKFQDKLSISGLMKGVGEKVAFTYDDNTAKVDASKLFVEKILALAGIPMYVKGTIDSQVDFKSLKPREGSFWIKGNNLITDPKEMKKLTGEAVKANISLDTSGTFKEGTGYIDTKIKSSLGNISLDNMVVDSERKTFKSSYLLDVTELKKLHKVIDQKLYGPLVLRGEWTKGEKRTTVTGETTTLGGKIDYILIGDDLSSRINNVPLENILGLLGHKKDFLGKAFGKGKYNLKQKSGVVDLDIKSFQIKPSPATNTIKMVIGKDPARVIFSSTKFHAEMKGKITYYTLHAKGSHSSIEITNGRVNKINNTNTAKFKFVYEKYTVYGKISGAINDPKVTIDTSAILKDKIDEQLQEKIDKALGGKAGEFLRGLKF